MIFKIRNDCRIFAMWGAALTQKTKFSHPCSWWGVVTPQAASLLKQGEGNIFPSTHKFADSPGLAAGDPCCRGTEGAVVP